MNDIYMSALVWDIEENESYLIFKWTPDSYEIILNLSYKIRDFWVSSTTNNIYVLSWYGANLFVYDPSGVLLFESGLPHVTATWSIEGYDDNNVYILGERYAGGYSEPQCISVWKFNIDTGLAEIFNGRISATEWYTLNPFKPYSVETYLCHTKIIPLINGFMVRGQHWVSRHLVLNSLNGEANGTLVYTDEVYSWYKDPITGAMEILYQDGTPTNTYSWPINIFHSFEYNYLTEKIMSSAGGPFCGTYNGQAFTFPINSMPSTQIYDLVEIQGKFDDLTYQRTEFRYWPQIESDGWECFTGCGAANNESYHLYWGHRYKEPPLNEDGYYTYDSTKLMIRKSDVITWTSLFQIGDIICEQPHLDMASPDANIACVVMAPTILGTIIPGEFPTVKGDPNKFNVLYCHDEEINRYFVNEFIIGEIVLTVRELYLVKCAYPVVSIFRLESTIPIDLATGVPTNTAILMTFNHELDTLTMSGQDSSEGSMNVYIGDTSGILLEYGELSHEDVNETIKTLYELPYNSLITVKLTTDLTDTSNVNLNHLETFSFTTEAEDTDEDESPGVPSSLQGVEQGPEYGVFHYYPIETDEYKDGFEWK